MGKSTAAKLLAARLGFRYLDTGALYRAIAWKVLQSEVPMSDHEQVAKLLQTTTLQVRFQDGSMRVMVDDRDVTDGLRAVDVTQAASVTSAIPAVREWLLPIQREIGQQGSVVAEGRDIGTKVFPSAPLKFFLDAAAAVRAERRHRELVAAGHGGPIETITQDLEVRDRRDRTRAVAPMTPAADAKAIDTSVLNAEQVVDQMVAAMSAVS